MSDERNNFPDEHRTADRPCGVELHKMAEQASDPATTEFYDIIGERERGSRVAGLAALVLPEVEPFRNAAAAPALHSRRRRAAAWRARGR